MAEHELEHEYQEEHGPTESVNSSAAGRQPLLLVTTVDIGEGRSDRIEVRVGDVPMDVAREFVIKHGLPPAIIPRLAVHLEENLAKVAAQKAAVAAVSNEHSTCNIGVLAIAARAAVPALMSACQIA
jgi:hypothetical protein